MDHITDAMEMVDHLPHPAFCVREGIIIKANSAAVRRMIEPGTSISGLLQTGKEEYAEFTEGCLYLTLCVCGESLGFSVSRKKDFDLFILEQDAQDPGLQAMALAARELRTPLSEIMYAANRLFPAAGLAENPETSEQAARINQGVYQMLRIIGNMSDANRYASNTASRQEVRDICAIVDEIFAKAAALVEQAGLRLEYSGISESIYTQVNDERLERAILNIISNAVKFSPENGLIQAKLTRRGSKLYLSVQDSGCGIAENQRGTLFSRYTRDPGLEEGRFGIGLGFVMIRSAAAQHGGTVLVDHPQGTGTRITMSLSIRPGEGNVFHSPVMKVDYAGELDRGLIELSDCLPASLYDSKKIN